MQSPFDVSRSGTSEMERNYQSTGGGGLRDMCTRELSLCRARRMWAEAAQAIVIEVEVLQCFPESWVLRSTMTRVPLRLNVTQRSLTMASAFFHSFKLFERRECSLSAPVWSATCVSGSRELRWAAICPPQKLAFRFFLTTPATDLLIFNDSHYSGHDSRWFSYQNSYRFHRPEPFAEAENEKKSFHPRFVDYSQPKPRINRYSTVSAFE